MTETPWMDWMNSHVGERTATGEPATSFDEEIFSHTSYGPLHGKMQPGCAATACSALEETGFKSPHNAAAISFKNYGEPCEMKYGCLVLFEFWDGSHHISFCNDKVVSENVVGCLGGNQHKEVSIVRFKRSRVIATRWPIK